MNTTELLIIGFIYIISVVVFFICGVIFAVKLMNDTISRE